MAGCDCTGCCGRSFKDFPDTMYVRFYYDDGDSVHIDYCAPMHKIATPQRTSCSCVQCYPEIFYASNPMMITQGSLIEPDRNPCCFAAVLHGTCPAESEGVISGECQWEYVITYPGFNGSVYTPISLDCLVEGSIGIPGTGGCIVTTDTPSGLITFSEVYIGGDTPEECDKLCCRPLPSTLYVTLMSNCPLLNGVTVELQQNTFGWPYMSPRPPDTVNNLGGYGSFGWVAYKKICGCNSLTKFEVYMTTWTENPLCRWGMSIRSNNTTTIIPDLEIEYSNDFCPPIEFTFEGYVNLEDEEDDPFVCCPGIENLTLVATVTG